VVDAVGLASIDIPPGIEFETETGITPTTTQPDTATTTEKGQGRRAAQARPNAQQARETIQSHSEPEQSKTKHWNVAKRDRKVTGVS